MFRGLEKFDSEIFEVLGNVSQEILEVYTHQRPIGTVSKGKWDHLTELDLKAEKPILELITKRFPSHQIFSEESGFSASKSDYTWIVDPLDGTTNLVNRIPLVGASVTLCRGYNPIYTTLFDYITGNLVSTGLKDKELVKGNTSKPLLKMSVGVINGYEAREQRDIAYSLLLGKTRRLISTWAPTIDFISMLGGGLDALVILKSEIEDQIGGLFALREAGFSVLDLGARDYEFPDTFNNILPSSVICRSKTTAREIIDILNSSGIVD